MKEICVVTGTRAEYGLLRRVMQGVRESPELKLQVVVTGTHLSPDFGLTYREIESDGYAIDRRVEMLLDSDTPVGVTKSLGIATTGFADALDQLRPDLLLLLGDRYELLAAGSAATIAGIPIAHLHGGERTEGAIDEAIRHSLTKMSHLHFVATDEYRQRVIQLGEDPGRVFTVGGLGVDCIMNTELLDRSELENELDFEFGDRNLLVTFHPVTLEQAASETQLAELLAALEALDDTHCIFSIGNADSESRSLAPLVEEFVSRHSDTARMFKSLGQRRYLSCLRLVDGVVGNSSSGLLEAPTFRKGAVNIGDRQRGRIRAASVIDCEPTREAIGEAIRTLYSEEFQERLKDVENPYGSGGASEAIIRVLEDTDYDGLLKKTFHDVTYS